MEPGHARVSRTFERQIDALLAAGIDPKHNLSRQGVRLAQDGRGGALRPQRRTFAVTREILWESQTAINRRGHCCNALAALLRRSVVDLVSVVLSGSKAAEQRPDEPVNDFLGVVAEFGAACGGGCVVIVAVVLRSV